MATLLWIAVAAAGWLCLALAVGLVIGAAARMRDRVGGPIPHADVHEVVRPRSETVRVVSFR